MPYCQHCGSEIEHVPEVAAAAEAVSAEVRIAEINAQRDVEVEKIRARQVRAELDTAETIAETEAEAEVAAAEATAEVIGEVIAAEAEAGEEEAEAEPPVIIADAPDDGGEDMAPPEVEHHESAPKSKPGWSFS